MNQGFPFFDIIFFAMVAAFILLRLRNVLGRRTGQEPRRPDRLARPPMEDGPDNVIRLPDGDSEPAPQGDEFSDVADATLAAGLTQVKLADHGFDREQFIDGARGAFEMVLAAFAEGDTAALRPLLADDVYEPFARAVRDREADGHTLESALVSLDESEIIEAGVNGRTAFLTMRFVSHQINVTRDEDGEVVHGDAGDSSKVVDLWTFERDTRSRDPNWVLAATRSPN